ncbi:MAG: peptidase C25, partial [Methylotenera sp.]|nr:peptidase C25 [Flavobacterium sp.]
MRKILLAIIVLLPLVSFTQIKGDVAIEWLEKKEMSYGDSKVIIPHFTGNSFHYDASNKTLLFTFKTKESVFFEQGKVQITNINYESISVDQLGDLASENIPKTINASLVISNSRDLKEAFVSISPIVKDDFGFKRIKSFSYEIQNNNAKTVQSTKRVNTISNTVLASGNWFQFYVEKSGVYKISKNFLQQL